MKKVVLVLLSIVMIFSLVEGVSSKNTVNADGTTYAWVPIMEWIDGDITSFALDPSNPRVLYLGTRSFSPSEGAVLYKSTDGGESWSPISRLFDGIWDIAVDPNDSNTIYVVSANPESSVDSDIYKSTDGGKSWIDITEKLQKEHPTGFVGCDSRIVNAYKNIYFLVSFPSYNGHVYYISTDGCKTWKQTNEYMWKIIAIDPKNPNVLYSESCKENVCGYKSTDGGNTWNPLAAYGDEIVFNPLNPNIIYILQHDLSGKIYSLYKSTDGGISVTDMTTYLPSKGLTGFTITNDGTILAYGNATIMKSVDGGVTWTKIPYPIEDWIMLRSYSSLVYAIGTGSIGILDSSGNVLKISVSSSNVDNVFFDPKEKDILYATKDTGETLYIYRSINSGKSWNLSKVLTMNSTKPWDFRLGYVFAIDPNTGIVYLIENYDMKLKLNKSTDKGLSWTTLDLPDVSEDKTPYDVAVDPTSPNTLFTIIGDKMLKSIDGGNSWTQVDLTSAKVSLQPYSIAISSKDGTIYAIGKGKDRSTVLVKSIDKGNNWINITNNTISNLYPYGGSWSEHNVRLLVSPIDNSIYIYGVSGGLFKSTDGGNTFKKVTDFSVSKLVIAPSNSNVLYVSDCATSPDVYKSVDGGDHWEKISHIDVSLIAVDPQDPNIFYADGKKPVKKYRIIKTIAGLGDIKIFPTSTKDDNFYTQDNIVALKAIPKNGYVFSGWSGSISSSNPIAQLKMDADKEIIAKFVKLTTVVLTVGRSVFTVNGTTQNLDSPPIIKNGRTLVPIRPIVESLGGNVSWDPVNKSVTISLGSTTVELWIGKNTAKVNGKSVLIDPNNQKVVPEIINGRTMLPLRFVAENIGCTVQWDQATQTITLTYGGQ
jgi:photosystem II stability/assembly factor-like uncharacterized protein